MQRAVLDDCQINLSGQSQRTQTIQWTNQNSKQIHSWRKTRKVRCQPLIIGFGSSSDWIKSAMSYFKPITKHGNTKLRQSTDRSLLYLLLVFHWTVTRYYFFGHVACFRRVEEFKEYGDMDMMMQYVKEVQTVQKKLTDSVEAIGFINEVTLSICLLVVSFPLNKTTFFR